MAENGGGENPNHAALFEAANKLRGSVESAEYKHIVLGLIFLKYISDSFQLRREELEAALADTQSEYYLADPADHEAVLEDRDEYAAANVFWVPAQARWEALLAAAQQPDIARRIDEALAEIENANPRLRNVLPQVYSRAPLSAELMGSLLQTIAKIGFGAGANEARDVLGRTYEYFIKEFARSEGHRGGEFFTPGPVARLLVEMLQPFEGRVLDPACGSCGLFVQSGNFIEAHGGNPDKISIYGQERNQATWRIGLMNLAIHGLSGEVRYTESGSLLDDAFPSLKADFVMANPPFNQKEWSTPAVLDDARWKYGTPPANNANYAWIQHFLHHLAPQGRAGFVMANGSLTSARGGEAEIRRQLILDDVVDCIVAMPAQLFYTTGIPVCLWFLDRDKSGSGSRDHRGETLFLDARHLGTKISRTQIEFSEQEIAFLASTYHAWRGTETAEYEDIAGFCKSATSDEIAAGDFRLSPARYVGASESEDDDLALQETMATLVDQLADDLAENERLTVVVRQALLKVGFEL
ncbi:MAG: class I SAM-dependent DNA methyltransferase [Solirubrobacteraceae bacterium]